MNNDIDRNNPIADLGFFLKPLSLRGFPVWLTILLGLLGMVYILNPTAGILELIPDNIPWIGNLDEGVAFTLLWYALVEVFEGGKYRKS